jgi:hypothetical protein
MGYRNGGGSSGPWSASYSWIDKSSGIEFSDYNRWGIFRNGGPGDSLPDYVLEPVNLVMTPENCAGGNFTQGNPGWSAWSTANCAEQAPFICEIIRERPGAQPAALLSPSPHLALMGCAGRRPSRCLPLPLPAATGFKPTFTATTTDGAFKIFTNATSFDHAEKACNTQGGHLASYATPGEQAEVERYMVEQGYLIPSFHQSYWIGLNTTAPGASSRNNWTWVDCSEPPSMTTYTAWGPGQPDNLEPPSACGQANHEFLGGDPEVWQWDDVQCSGRAIAVCRITRKFPAPLLSTCLPAIRQPQRPTTAAARTPPAATLCPTPAHPPPPARSAPGLCLRVRDLQEHLRAQHLAAELWGSRADLQRQRRPPRHARQPGRAAGGGELLCGHGLPVPDLPQELLDRLHGGAVARLQVHRPAGEPGVHALGQGQPQRAGRAQQPLQQRELRHRQRQPDVPARLGLVRRAVHHARALHLQDQA